MKERLELIVIGDDSVRKNVYKSISLSVQERKFRANQTSFPLIPVSNDQQPILLESSTSATFTLDNKQISYGVHEYTNNNYSLGNSQDEPYLLNKNLTVVVCIDAHATTNSDHTKFNNLIDELKNIRKNKFFNIIPVMINNDQMPDHIYATLTEQELKKNYTHLCRKLISIKQDEVDNPEYTAHLSRILDISMATSVYNEVETCINLLNEFRESLNKRHIKQATAYNTPVAFDVAPIVNILKNSFNINNDKLNTMDSLREYFKSYRELLNGNFVLLKNKLNKHGVHNQVYTSGIFLNVLCSIAAIFASLTIIGIPFVYNMLSKNMKYHNNYLKFFATNNIDEDRASIAKVEDKTERLYKL